MKGKLIILMHACIQLEWNKNSFCLLLKSERLVVIKVQIKKYQQNIKTAEPTRASDKR